jgi:hypothetical protein
MTSKADALTNAIEKQAKSLDPAQMEFILAEFETYKWNAKRINQLEKQLEAYAESEDRNLDMESKLFRQRHQLVAEQSALFSHIMRWLKGTATEESALDAFLNA